MNNPPVLSDRLTGVVPGRVSAEADLAEAVHNAWLVIEAIPERLELKRDLFGHLDELAATDAILASNSSSYASRMLLDKVNHPERVLNIHFYMPPKEAAVDVMSCDKTDPRRHQLRDGDVAAVRVLPVRSAQGECWFHL
jgi:3-hydroxybutyryl-CoA dehydrogenase